ncbi:benzyl alcohol O-benzoyltransferase-like [Telopea speciosissima]|uniref:benzyl alcohol O-benzoyltransferase-like n=1 Tax=Telopea speciosissima TaxID=54955 RepID=UPI001CC35E5F|nr:benzyl alcohol O-benzoyltransferase-like [Telopea speciosissima]
MALQSSLMFSVRRRKPELIPPAKPTPREYKCLSEIDDQGGYRFQFPVILFYRNIDPAMCGIDAVKVIREAIGKVLVFYYPFAGRLREGPGRKLIVDCNAEGVLFIEADADVSLQQFGDTICPPFPCMDEFLYEVPGSEGIADSPLLLIQVTRLICGGFIVAVRLNHVMSDVLGLSQFLTAVGEIACGRQSPSVKPVWKRELLNARDPPRVTCVHHEFDDVDKVHTNGKKPKSLDQPVHRNFFFGPTEIAALRKHVPSHLQACSTYELVTACLWRCRTVALQLDPDDEVRLLFPVNVNRRSKTRPPLPVGFYGNAFVLPAGLSTAGKLCWNPLSYALELVMKVKSNATDEYMRSLADLMVIKRQPHYKVAGSFVVPDVTRAGLCNVDFGWGKAVYGGPAKADVGTIPGIMSMHIPFKNSNIEEGAIVVPIFLSEPAMERFAEELANMIGGPLLDPYAKTTVSGLVRSAL